MEQKNSRKRLNSLILLVAFTAIMLIVSTYAWFSAQKNVTISGLEGKVNVAEGLMVSLDAKNWSQAVSLDSTITNYLDAGFTFENPYDLTAGDGNENLKSSELIPTSTTGSEDLRDDTDGDGTIETGEKEGNDEISFYRGINIAGLNTKPIELHTIQQIDPSVTDVTSNQYPGYHAVDIFLQNSSKIDTDAGEVQGTTTETLQLNTNSVLQLLTAGKESTGLQNTTRVALALYQDKVGVDTGDDDEDGNNILSSVDVTATQKQILKAFDGQKITDIAIWEPNAGNHTDYVVRNMGDVITWNPTVKALYLSADITKVVDGNTITVDADDRDNTFTATEKLPTYALLEEAETADEELTEEDSDLGSHAKTYSTGKIADIYDWNDHPGDNTVSPVIPAGTPATGVKRQIALQTEKSAADYSTVDGGVRNLVSITSPGTQIYEFGNETSAVKFEIKKNQVSKLRLYIWLEGQDVDTINQASHGGGVKLDLGLVKGQDVGPQGS